MQGFRTLFALVASFGIAIAPGAVAAQETEPPAEPRTQPADPPADQGRPAQPRVDGPRRELQGDPPAQPAPDQPQQPASDRVEPPQTEQSADAPARPAPDQAAAPQTPSAAAASGGGAAEAGAGAEAGAVKALPPEADEAQGQCKTPRQAWLQLLYWLQKEHYDPEKAAMCFDTSRMRHAGQNAPKVAEQLIQVLDSKGWFIKPDELPTESNYLDPGTKTHRYVDPAVAGKGIEVYKRGGRWLFTPDTLQTVPDLYPGLTVRIVNALPAWFRTQVLGIEIWKLLGVLVLVFIAFLVQKTTVFLIRTYLKRLVSRANLNYLDKAVSRADRPIGGLAMAGIFYLGIPNLLFPATLSKIAFVATEALAAYSVVWLAYRLIDVLQIALEARAGQTDTKLDDQLVPMTTKTLKVFVSVIGVIFVLQNLDVDVSSLLAGLGLGGLAFALAAKDTVANFFGSVTIFVDKPFQIGDWVTLAGAEGIVEEVGFRTTRVRTFYNSLITVPNHMVTGNIIDNYGMRKYRRYSTTLGLAYDTPPVKVQGFCEAVRAAIKGMPGMRQDYYMVEFKEFGPSSLNIMVYCFMDTPTWDEELRTRTNLNLAILRIAKELGVSFAFPTQTLHIDSMVEPGASKPSHSGPTEEDAIAGIVSGFAVGGGSRLESGFGLTTGYEHGDDIDPDTAAGKGGDG